MPDTSKRFFEIIALYHNKMHKAKYPNYIYNNETRRRKGNKKNTELQIEYKILKLT